MSKVKNQQLIGYSFQVDGKIVTVTNDDIKEFFDWKIGNQPKPTYPVWGVRIDRNNSDPYDSVEYIGDAQGFTPAKAGHPGSWDTNPIFASIKPCLLAEGNVMAYLDPNDFNRTSDGTDLGKLRQLGDTMVEFNKCFYRISQDEQYNYIEISNNADSLKDGFTDWAFSYKGKVSDKFYVGAYLGYILNGRLRSIAGATPTGSKTIGQFRTAAQANGAGYEQMAFNKLVLLQILYVIRFKSLNSQEALGKGLTSASDYGLTGRADAQGLYYGNQDASSSVKCHGLEDFWGNKLQWVDGLITTDKISVSDGNFNDIGDDYEKVVDLPETVSGIITDIYGDNKLGFLPKAADDDINAGESNYCNWGSTWNDGVVNVPFFGGVRVGGAVAGAFQLVVVSSASFAFAYVGARLLYMGEE